ncbi:MAG: class I SAM-dependent methyltransferase [Candidatus Bathyarchaeia archaeon]|jgi:SAM-dependent methyltransferase
MQVYNRPIYYEIAFSFFDAKKQVDAFESLIDEFSNIKVNRFLDIACGPSLQLREIAKRGYEAVGLDLAPEMLNYLSEKAVEEGVKIDTMRANMSNFRLDKKADFAFIMMGSLEFTSNRKFLNHLNSVASSLNKGGLYFIQNKALNLTGDAEQSWEVERKGIKVKTVYKTVWKDKLNQIFTETITLGVNDHSQILTFTSEEDLKFIFPQEFKTIIEFNGKFEFLGWWEGTESDWSIDKPIEKAKFPSNLNVVLLRRK